MTSYREKNKQKKFIQNKKKLTVTLILFAILYLSLIAYYICKYGLSLKHMGATLYLLDYNFYYGTRIFIGSIYALLFNHISENMIFAFNIAAYLLSVVLFFIVTKPCLDRAIKRKSITLLFVFFVFFTCPYSVLQFAGWLGAYDIWLILAALLCCIMSGNKYLKWFVPMICVAAVFTHYAFVFSLFPAVVSVQIFYILREDNRHKAGDIVSAALTFAATFLSAVYCAFFAGSTVKMSESELFGYMSERLGAEVGNRDYIINYYFSEDSVFQMLKNLALSIWNKSFVKENIAFFLPFFALIMLIWITCIKKSTRKQDKFKFLVFIAAFAVSSSVMFFIIEANRWRSAAIISQITIICVCLKSNDKILTEVIDTKDNDKWKSAMRYLAVYGLVIDVLSAPHPY